ncbi:MAG: hypothetical protein HYT79_06500 [Elusimicrobia bacterium]|nr:hypothetical protein [Elusimicrobiota bacterium]
MSTRNCEVISKMKKGVIVFASFAFLIAHSPALEAASKNIAIHVRVAPAISLAVPTTYYDFGDMAVSSTAVAISSLAVVNDSSGRTQDYRINVSTYSTGPSSQVNWLLGSLPAPDFFQLCWQVTLDGAVRPPADTSGNCTTNGWIIFDTDAGTSQPASAPGGLADGVISNAIRNLWFQIRTPTSTSYDEYQTMSITVTAAAANSF